MLLIATLISTTLAIVMSVIAWRATADQRRRSDARVAALAQAIHGANDRLDTFRPVELLDELDRLDREDERGLFAIPAEPSGSRYAVALAAAGFVVASVAAAAIVFSGESGTNAPAQPAAAPGTTSAPAAAPASAPLELISLTHEREGGTLTIRGVVRNPEAGVETDRLTAVVMLFDRDGGFVASGRATVDAPSLIPGGEAPFVVTVPAAGQIGRYRVSFRAGDRIVSHVDKRGTS